MKINFTEKDSKCIRDIIEEYRDVSRELYIHQDEAKKIQEKVDVLSNELKEIKSREDRLMKRLHQKYGDFGLNDIYESINDL